MQKPDKNQILYQEASNLARHYQTLLFQRLNYFLISSAFLVASFVQLALNPRYFSLALVISAGGIALSWAYTSINFYNAKIIQVAPT
jgi:hypothetical protein